MVLRPIVEDIPEEIDISAVYRLCVVEIVRLERDSASDRFIKRHIVEQHLTLLHPLRQILHRERKLGSVLSERNADVSKGTANLQLISMIDDASAPWTRDETYVDDRGFTQPSPIVTINYMVSLHSLRARRSIHATSN